MPWLPAQGAKPTVTSAQTARAIANMMPTAGPSTYGTKDVPAAPLEASQPLTFPAGKFVVLLLSRRFRMRSYAMCSPTVDKSPGTSAGIYCWTLHTPELDRHIFAWRTHRRQLGTVSTQLTTPRYCTEASH
mmetsp:Transcript_32209/g.56314  ORF Transcript_32209/g.56314 Transcript_32209/m.56314 type:complete len:131 (+) Transcript_32209:507-899(+)